MAGLPQPAAERLVPAGDPFLALGRLVADQRGLTVTGAHHGVGRQCQQLVRDRLDDRREVAERAAGCTRSAVEQCVALKTVPSSGA